MFHHCINLAFSRYFLTYHPAPTEHPSTGGECFLFSAPAHICRATILVVYNKLYSETPTVPSYCVNLTRPCQVWLPIDSSYAAVLFKQAVCDTVFLRIINSKHCLFVLFSAPPRLRVRLISQAGSLRYTFSFFQAGCLQYGERTTPLLRSTPPRDGNFKL